MLLLVLCLFDCLSFCVCCWPRMPRLEKQDDPVLMSAQLTKSLLICVCPPARTDSLSLSLFLYIHIHCLSLYLSCTMHRVSIRTSTWILPPLHARSCTISNAFELQQPPATPTSCTSAGSLGQLNEGNENENEHSKDGNNNEATQRHGRIPSSHNNF